MPIRVGNVVLSIVVFCFASGPFSPVITVQADAFLYYSGITRPDSLLNPDVTIPSYTRVDVRLGWRLQPRWEVSLVGQNLLQARHLECIPEALSTPSYVRRAFYVKSVWRF
jgi:iron complex outermembrane recepter protein